jgi:hypothetical protein
MRRGDHSRASAPDRGFGIGRGDFVVRDDFDAALLDEIFDAFEEQKVEKALDAALSLRVCGVMRSERNQGYLGEIVIDEENRSPSNSTVFDVVGSRLRQWAAFPWVIFWVSF